MSSILIGDSLGPPASPSGPSPPHILVAAPDCYLGLSDELISLGWLYDGRTILFLSPLISLRYKSDFRSIYQPNIMENVLLKDTIYRDEQSMIIWKIGSTLDFGIISLISRSGVPERY